MRRFLRALWSWTIAGIAALASLVVLVSWLPDPEPEAPITYRQPSFAMLARGEDDGKGAPEIDLADVDEESVRLGAEFRAARVPRHDCVAPLNGPNTFAWLEQASEDYANCVLDSWGPWLAEHGAQEPVHIDVQHCSLPQHLAEDGCRGSEGTVRWQPSTNTYRLHPGTDVRHSQDGWLMATVNRMVASALQQQVRTSGGEPVLLQGVSDPDAKAASRRKELQAECLSVALQRASSDKTVVSLADQVELSDQGAESWDEKSQRFWRAQGRKGFVGECDAMWAAPSLVSYREN